MDCIVYGVTKSRTRVSDFHFHFTFTFSNVNISILLCKGSLGLAHLAKQKPYPVIKLGSPELQADSLSTELPGNLPTNMNNIELL